MRAATPGFGVAPRCGAVRLPWRKLQVTLGPLRERRADDPLVGCFAEPFRAPTWNDRADAVNWQGGALRSFGIPQVFLAR